MIKRKYPEDYLTKGGGKIKLRNRYVSPDEFKRKFALVLSDNEQGDDAWQPEGYDDTGDDDDGYSITNNEEEEEGTCVDRREGEDEVDFMVQALQQFVGEDDMSDSDIEMVETQEREIEDDENEDDTANHTQDGPEVQTEDQVDITDDNKQ